MATFGQVPHSAGNMSNKLWLEARAKQPKMGQVKRQNLLFQEHILLPLNEF